ncbi:uncharacterized protein LOC112595660 [Melanaphis sacchari]|uniref:uncharacterized protein LOC112595660 n=1 Tax=Melanaphis sacchari TaxID=742174 RepID=UPI000DC14CE3|nr:uncharacterized protein LOC112595660 [Melanaphis sacchari]
MAEEVEKYDSHRFDDVFYAYTELFMKRNFTDVSWSNDFHETNFDRVTAFPIEIVRPYMERLLQVHGKGPLLHTIIAANFECKPLPSNTGRFTLVMNNARNSYTMTNDLVGLIAACGLNTRKVANCVYECLRCQSSIEHPEISMSIYDLLRMHATNCEMSIDRRYLKPLTDFWRKCDHDAYRNFLHKTVAETVLMKMGLLIIRPHRYNEIPYSVFTRNRLVSLHMVLQSRKRPRFDEDALNRMVQAGYFTFSTPRATSWRELKKTLREFTRTPIVDSKITCFSCHHAVTLSAEFANDPWKYHAKKSPSCKFLLMKMGSDYVRRVRESMYDFRPRNRTELNAAVIDPELDLHPPTIPVGEFFDMCEGMTDRKTTELRVALSTTTVTECTVCSTELRTVALMSCLHIATCVDCSFAIRDCPLCRTIITGFMMPVFQSDGSFWIQPGCVGGNYFMNLPCRHLIETCVPNNVNQCPKADAVEEDNIYCVVCGKMNLGKLRVYL